MTVEATDPGADLGWELPVDDATVDIDVQEGVVAVLGASGRCALLDATDGQLLQRLSLPGGGLRVRLAEDASAVVATGPTGYLVAAVPDGRTLAQAQGSWCADAAWHGSRVAVAARRNVVALQVSADGATLLQRTGEAAGTITGVSWGRGGRDLLASTYGGVEVFRPHATAAVGRYAYAGSHLCLAVSPDGRWVCTGNQDRSVHIWRVGQDNELEMGGYPSKVSIVRFDPTGRWLAAIGAPDVTVWDFEGKGPAGRAPQSFALHESVTAVAWAPAPVGRLASHGREGRVAVWDTAGRPGRERPAVAVWPASAGHAALAWADGNGLVVSGRDGSVRRINLP